MTKKIDYAGLYTLRADGRYQASYIDDAGKRHYVYNRDPAKLYEKMQTVGEPQEKLFCDVMWEWKEQHVDSLERGTQAAYRAPMQRLSARYDGMALSCITPGEVNRLMLEEKQKSYSHKHASTIKSIIKQVYDFAIVSGYTNANPTSSVEVPRGMTQTCREAPEKETCQIIQRNLEAPFGDFVAVLLYTGLRTEEAAALQWGDVDFKGGTIKVNRAVDLHGTPKIKSTKTEAGKREVPILPPLKPFLRKPKGVKQTDYVFSDGGELLTRGQINSRWINWCKCAGLAEQVTYANRHRGKTECTRTEWRPTITPHQLRHNYATVLYEAGIDELTAQDLMGHADIATTRAIYTSLRKQHKSEEIKKLSKAFDVNSDVKSRNSRINTANN